MSSSEEETPTPRTTPKKTTTKPPFTRQTPTEAPVDATVKYTNSLYKKTKDGWTVNGQKVNPSSKIIQKLEQAYLESQNKPKGSQKPVKGNQTLTAKERSLMTAAQRRSKKIKSESFNTFGEFLKENNLI